MKKKSIRWDCTSRTRSSASLTLFAKFHHLRFSPCVFLTWYVRIEGYELMEATHARDIGDIINSILSQSASNSQQFQRQCSLSYSVSLFFQDFSQELSNAISRLLIGNISWWKNENPFLAAKCESGLALWARNSNYNYRFCIRQSFWSFEIKES